MPNDHPLLRRMGKYPSADAVDAAASKQNVESDYEHDERVGGHVVLRKSPWVQRAEHKELPAKELEP